MTTPVQLAIAHQIAIRDMVIKMRDNSSCIGRLLVGRTVRRRRDGIEFGVTEARLGMGGSVTIHGRPPGKRRTALIGGVMDIEIVEPKP